MTTQPELFENIPFNLMQEESVDGERVQRAALAERVEGHRGRQDDASHGREQRGPPAEARGQKPLDRARRSLVGDDRADHR